MADDKRKERLLKWYAFSELPVGVVQDIAFPSSPATPVTITSILLEQIKSNDRINLEATIQWTASLAGTILDGVPSPFSILGYQQAIFQFWRDNVGPRGSLVYQYTTTGGFIAFGIAATTAVSVVRPNSITTTITATDFNVPKGGHTYYLTVAIPAVNPGGAIGGGGIGFAGASLTAPTILGRHFAGFVIDENET